MIAKQFLVRGRVQGVGFRYHTEKTASELGLQGWVRNLEDGRVEVLAKGELAAMQLFSDWLQQGPRMSSVEDLEMRVIDESIVDGEFAIRDDGSRQWQGNS